MQLIARYRIRGVAKVISGKGVGTKVAEPGDLFEPCDDKTGNTLLADRNAYKPGENQQIVTGKVGPAVLKQAEQLGGAPLDLGNTKPAKPETATQRKAREKKEAAAAAEAAKKAAEAPAAPPVETKTDDDLGLGDDNDKEETFE